MAERAKHIAQSRLREAQSSRAKHVVFDWNSTLLDDFHIIHNCMNHIMEHVGKPPFTVDHFRDAYEVPFEQLYVNLGFTLDEAKKMMELERDMFHNFYEPRAVAAQLREGAAEILQHTKSNGLHTYILSNHIVDPIKTQLKRLEIEHFFTEVLAYSTLATQFKDMTKGERLRRYLADNKMTGQPTMIVGDSLEEIDIAREQGFISIAITGGGASEKRLREHKPDYIIHSLHELKPILAERGFAT